VVVEEEGVVVVDGLVVRRLPASVVLLGFPNRASMGLGGLRMWTLSTALCEELTKLLGVSKREMDFGSAKPTSLGSSLTNDLDGSNTGAGALVPPTPPPPTQTPPVPPPPLLSLTVLTELLGKLTVLLLPRLPGMGSRCAGSEPFSVTVLMLPPHPGMGSLSVWSEHFGVSTEPPAVGVPL
jgi:hypothetical protein